MSADSPLSFDYDAFISYRRKDGSVYAERLRQRLVDYVMPKGFPRRRLKIFLDRIYEQANEDFFARTIEPALKSSKWLIVVQTPEAITPTETGEDNWVAREVRCFRGLPQKNNVAVALAIGGIKDPLPAELTLELPHIERVDISTLGGEKPMLSEQQLLTFIGPLHDVPGSKMPDLRRDAEGRARRRRVTLAATALTVIALLATLASIAFYQRNRAEQELMRQASLRLGAEAARIPAGELDLAYLLAVRALELAPTNEAARALMDVGSREPRLVTYLHCPGAEMAHAVRLLPLSRAIALTCDGVLLVSSLDDGRELHRETLLENARRLEVVRTAHREQLVLGGSRALRVWSPGQGIRAIPAGGTGITAMHASSDGTSLVTGDLAGNVRLWQVGESWKSDVIGTIGSEVIAVKNDAAGIRAIGRDGSAWIRNAAGMEPSVPFAISPVFALDCDQQPVTRYASPSIIEPEENLEAYANDSNDVVVARGTEDCVLLRGNTHNLADLTAARMGQRLLVASAGQIGRRRFGAIVWDLDQQHPFTRRLLPPPSSAFGRTAIAISGSRAAIARSGESLIVWRTNDWSKINGPVVDVTAIAVSHDGSQVAVVADGSLRRFRIGSNDLSEIETKSPRVYDIAYDTRGTVVGVGDDALWRIGPSTAERVAIAALTDEEMIVSCSRLTADGHHFLVVNETKLLIHDTVTGKVTGEIALPQNKTVASCSGLDAVSGEVVVRVLNTYELDPIQIFDFETKALTRTLQSPFTMHSGLPAILQNAMLSSNARLGVASLGDEQSIVVWDTDSGSLMAALPFQDAIDGWALSDSGAQVLAATEQGVVLWPLAAERWIEQALRVANRPLSPGEARTYGVAVQ